MHVRLPIHAVKFQMEFLQSPELTYSVWNPAGEIVFSKIKDGQITEFEYMFAIKYSFEIFQRGSVEEFMRESPIKVVVLLLLALSAIRFCISFHVVDVNYPVNKLLEMLSTCRGHWTEVEDDSSCRSPLSRLKLTSRTTMLLEDTNSSGRPPYNELPVRLPRDGAMRPSRPLDGRETSMTVTPSHLQQPVPSSCHDLPRLESCESPARNWRRDAFSCSVQELAGMANETSSTRAMARIGTGNLLLLYFMYEKWCDCMASY
ncbi:hypothetical protein U9M48_025677 [Paspalum notatum var. saurae]|uniref:Uncharacterized protein n=1 Tax=Paspalum notatum var. saurae TaxID=547442 RepID=A0AAQ3TT26_PASNO